MSYNLPNVTPQIVMFWNSEPTYQSPATRTQNTPVDGKLSNAILMWNFVSKDPNESKLRVKGVYFNDHFISASASGSADVANFVVQNGSNIVKADYTVPDWSYYSAGLWASFTANASLAMYILPIDTSGNSGGSDSGSGSGGGSSDQSGSGGSSGNSSGSGNGGSTLPTQLTQPVAGLPLYIWLIIAAVAVLLLAAVVMMRRPLM